MYIMRSVRATNAILLAFESTQRAFSTILSQIAMTLGGSRFPGALGAMLIEILPLLRGIGSDIEHALGDDSPALIPTVMVAYALTSFLIGIISIALGVFKAGLLVRKHSPSEHIGRILVLISPRP